MTRSEPPAARLLRWLLVVLTLAGVGLTPGTHCTDTSSALQPGGPTLTAPHRTVAATPADLAHQQAPSGRPASETTAGDCHVSAPTTEPTVLAGAVVLSATAGWRSVSSTSPRTLVPLRAPTATLTQLGVSRT